MAIKRFCSLSRKHLSLDYETVLLFCIFTFGTFLRFYALDFQAFWEDEIWTYNRVNKPSFSAFISSLDLMGRKQMVYYIVCYSLSWLYPNDPILFRYFSALMGSASILAIYLTGKLLFDKRVGLLSSLILMSSQIHIDYSRTARVYAVLLFVLLVSTRYLNKIIRALGENENLKKLDLLGFYFFGLLTSYLHYFGFAILFGIFFMFTIANPRALKFKFLIVFLPFAILHIPLLFLINEVRNPAIGLGFASVPVSLKDILNLFVYITGYTTYKPIHNPILLATLAALPLYLFSAKSKQPFFIANFLISACWSIIPFVVAYYLSPYLSLWVARYFLVILPGFIFVISACFCQTLRTRTSIIVFVIVYFALSLHCMFFVKNFYRTPSEPQIQLASIYVTRTTASKPINLVITDRSTHENVWEWYLNSNRKMFYKIWRSDENVLKNLIYSSNEIWLTGSSEKNIREYVEKSLYFNEYKMKKEATFFKVVLYKIEKNLVFGEMCKSRQG